jgi:hypothetical protein
MVDNCICQNRDLKSVEYMNAFVEVEHVITVQGRLLMMLQTTCLYSLLLELDAVLVFA